MEELVEQLRDAARVNEELEILDEERVQELTPFLEGRRPGRFVRCSDEQVASVLDDLLLPGILLTRRIGELILVCRDEDGAPVLAIRGHSEHLVQLIDRTPALRFVVAPPEQSWKIERIRPRHLRVEGAVWTTFFPWVHVHSSLGLGCIIALITAMAMWSAHGEFWLPAGGPGTGLTERSVEGFSLAVLAPGGLAVVTNFVSLCGLGPDQSRPSGFWVKLFAISAVAIVFAVGLAIVHQPVNAAH